MRERVMDYFNLFDITRFIHYGSYTIEGLAAKSVAVCVFDTSPHCTSLEISTFKLKEYSDILMQRSAV